ncbi:PREDICTED: DENN domain-containing protein 2C [Gavialis gangeticus]|uniref:DENN domain-containing protein 2C n=1 Tax=Gavialis gangeticus TaxID=94835 RepID=UPI00092EDEB2|nr:PREDICTED: DENN domain-containing protein 2C [Gavialis gangeticus]
MHPADDSFSRAATQTLSRSHCRNIKQKISQWEGRARGGAGDGGQQTRDFGVKYDQDSAAPASARSQAPGKARPADAKSLGLDFGEGPRPCHQGKGGRGPAELPQPQPCPRCSVPPALDNGDWQPGCPDPARALPPGNFYTSRGLWRKMEPLPPAPPAVAAADPKRKRGSCGSVEKELPAQGLGLPAAPRPPPPRLPPPKPRRTFRYLLERDAAARATASTDVSTSQEQLLGGQRGSEAALPPAGDPEQCPPRRIRGRAQRKSFEFEDVQGFRSRRAAAGTPKPQETNGTAGSRLYYTQSEDNLYEDVVYVARENPYEDIKALPLPLWRVPSAWKLFPPLATDKPPKPPPKPPFFGRKTMELKNPRACMRGKLVKDTTLPVTLSEWKLFRAGEAASRRRKDLPPLVLKIQEIFDSKRGKKRVKLQPCTGKEVPPAKGETSGNESDSENLPKGRHKRLLQVQVASKRNPHYQTLERDLIELQEQQLFELFVVVSLQKKSAEASYTPQVIQQFPSKPEHHFRQSKDTEERLKVIPGFCFPDPKDWVPASELKSETFSFVLTGEDGSRWFGYCKKLLPEGKGKRLPEVYCMVSHLGCFNLFSKILDEVEKRREISPALVHPFMRSVMEAPFPAPGRTIAVKSFLPGAGNEVIELCRPLDSRLEHVDFECLFQCLSVCHLIRVCASLLLERRVIFVADSLSTLSKCGHAVVAMLYPFTWQHTYIPVLPAPMIDIVCSPTPFLIGILSCSLPQLQDLPVEEVLIVDLCADRFLQEVSDEDEILPPKLQAALTQILEERSEILYQEQNDIQGDATLASLVSEAFVWFFVEIVGHYSLHMNVTEKGERVFQREPFRKSHTSRNVRHFLDLFMETQMFAGFIQDRELRKSGVKGLFEVRAFEYLETIPETERSGMNKILRSLGTKMKFLQKK